MDAGIMAKYMPEYHSLATYEMHLAENKCRAAIVNAAKMERAEALVNPQLMFAKERNEARTKLALDKAQRDAARIEPQVNKIFDSLAAAESDRTKLTGTRWQAAYDTAYGRACAAKARVDGYNAMVAALKRGKTFTKPDSNTWLLEPSENIESGSAVQKIAEKAQQYLERVKTEHAGTPWAIMAETELQTPLGWAWREQ